MSETLSKIRLIEDAYALKAAHKMLKEIDVAQHCESREEAIAYLGLCHQTRSWQRKLEGRVRRLLK